MGYICERSSCSLRRVCSVLGVSRASYYRRLGPVAKARWHDDAALLVEIHQAYLRSKQTYGVIRIGKALRGLEIHAGRKRIGRLMRILGIQGRSWRQRSRKGHLPPATTADLLRRQFNRWAPGEVWMQDITEIHTSDGTLYIALVEDAGSRGIVGWACGSSPTAALVVQAFEMALAGHAARKGLIVHSDRGTQYAAHEFQHVLQAVGAQQSFSRPGTPHDNACVESLVSTLKREWLGDQVYATHAEAQAALEDYIAFYNTDRLHSTLGYRSPAEWSADYAAAA